MTNRKALLFVAPAVLLASAIVFGQSTTATLSGVIRDASGAVVPGVKVTAKNTQTSATRETTTDTEGRYSLTNLGPGQYEVRAERTGFRRAVQSGVTLAVGGATVVDLTVQVGDVNEVVEIKQEEPLIEPTKAEVSRVVNEQSIESLPIIGRNFVDFAKLSSGVAPGRENVG
ncbi:MAG: carboxypeptidase-like regulatory domain-containing protein, partial [Acidobacteria bacterium]|nr:carboxypeptidase-like regulatory domain-containing protein [Acidobacteriota bacterium]